MKKILIQANNLDVVIDTFLYIFYHPNCAKQDLANYCGFTLRQVDYYTNACKYLDLIDEHWKLTPLAKDIVLNNPAEITERIYERIITDELMGPIFARMYVLPSSNHSEYALELVKEYYPGYSDAVYVRRSDNIVKWCKRIINEINIKHK